jgi:pyruvate dehydrogenase (quinone)
VDKPEQIAGASEAALGADEPVILEAMTDPNVPLLSSRITLERARKMIGNDER